MCGVLGMVSIRGKRPSVGREEAARLCDLMAHRGPDGAGAWAAENAVFAHRRLAVIDPTPAGAQPFVSADGRRALVYNGELYNDAELRAALSQRGVRFRTACDTETLFEALGAWGAEAAERLRGMYAFGYIDLDAGVLLLGRDPMGIKPLYYAGLGDEVVFASEVAALLGHPRLSPRPDAVTLSAYLTTIRTTLGDRTLFEGVRTLRPGEWLTFALDAGLNAARRDWWARPAAAAPAEPVEAVREAVREAVERHLRSDVPLCCLLSGGLDSTIIAATARRKLPELWSYCAGAAGGEDLEHARRAAQTLGTRHAEAVLSRDGFRERWPWMVRALGLPLSTPNEVAIYEVAARLRADSMVVTLSGEGADELFGGYQLPLREAAAFERARTGHPGEFELAANAWTPVQAKGAILREELWIAGEHDRVLFQHYREEFDRLAGGEPLQAHLRFQRRINLAGLLSRLDTATMLASVEGRTPFADQEVALLAESLPVAEKFIDEEGRTETKRVLRAAFADVLPRHVLERPKASFPLPFQEWIGDFGPALRASPFAQRAFTAEAIEAVAEDPPAAWRFAWPMINLALWGDRWWG